MGLIKAAEAAISSTLSDQWEDYITCDSMDSETLVVKKTTKSGQISAKSRIQVNPGQVAIIFDSGKILDATAEEGIYTFDGSTSPSLFAGQFAESFKEAWQRFTYNGTPAKEQAIYYVNVKEIFDNKFGSSSPIPYDDPVYHDIRIKYHGSYTFRISNPLVFFEKVVGNVSSVYTKGTLMEQANGEFLTCIAGAIGKCAADGIKYSYLTNEQLRIAEYMNDALDEKWGTLRGMEVVSVALDTPVPDDQSQKRIEQFADARFYSTSENAAGRMVAATATAMESAAANENGAANGFMGLGMMNMAGGAMMGGQNPVSFTQPAPQAAAVATPAAPSKVCTNCGSPVDGKFCSNCGTAAPEDKKCANCGTVVTGKFCTNCGTPVDAPAVENAEVAVPEKKVCPNCGAEPLEGAKFCVECGTSIE